MDKNDRKQHLKDMLRNMINDTADSAANMKKNFHDYLSARMRQIYRDGSNQPPQNTPPKDPPAA